MSKYILLLLIIPNTAYTHKLNIGASIIARPAIVISDSLKGDIITDKEILTIYLWGKMQPICLNMSCPSYRKCKLSAHNNKTKKDTQSYTSYDSRECRLNEKNKDTNIKKG